jgi:tetratricopeptide (TPR) repeat protein
MERFASPFESLPASDPLRAVLGGAALMELNAIARLARNSVFVLAIYNTPASRKTLIEAIERQTYPLPNLVFDFETGRADPRLYLEEIPAQYRGRRYVIHFCDIENSLEVSARLFDLERDSLARYPHLFLLWIQNPTRAAFARLAPNLFSRHSGVFDLRLGVTSQAGAQFQAQRSGWEGLGTGYQDLEEWERLHTLYAKLLSEYSADPSSLPETLAELHLRLGRLDFARADYRAADAHFELARQLLSDASPADLRAEAYYYTGQMYYRLHDDHDAALESYHAALQLFRQVGDKLGEANVLQAIGDVQQFRKEIDAALESYHAALQLFRQVGAKLGEANVRKAIGDVQQFRKEIDAALESYNAALQLFRQVGDKLGEANVLQAIGHVQQFRDDRDAALESYHAALQLFRQVGDKLGEANVLAALARLSLSSGDIPAAEKQLEQVIAMRRVIGDLYSEGADYGNFAIALLELGHKAKAKEYALKARPIFEKIGLPSSVEMIDSIIAASQ